MSTFDINALPDFDAQIAHVGWGAFLALAFALWLPIWAAVLISVGVSALKESFESLGWALWEPNQPWSSSITDFEYWCIGAAASFVLLILHKVL